MPAMKVVAMTVTAGRSRALANSHEWMRRQTRKPDRWQIVNSGPALSLPDPGCPLSILHTLSRTPPGWQNFRENLVQAHELIPDGWAVLWWEDDDWYGPEHIELAMAELESSVDLSGSEHTRDWSLKHRTWLESLKTGCAPLSGTAVGPAARRYHSLRHQDLQLWRDVKKVPEIRAGFRPSTQVGINCYPGPANLSAVSAEPPWRPDQGAQKLREWVGDADAERILDESG